MWNGPHYDVPDRLQKRFYINKPPRGLSTAGLHQLQITDGNIDYLLFAFPFSFSEMHRILDKVAPGDECFFIETCHFFIPGSIHPVSKKYKLLAE